MKKRLFLFVLGSVMFLSPMPADATNGMSATCYGAISCGMGSASIAYDHGIPAVMSNPATLSLMPVGTNRIDVGLLAAGLDVDASVVTPAGKTTAHSTLDTIYIPPIGWVGKQNRFTYGLSLFAQGGAGTEYGKNSWMADPSNGANTALTEGLVNRSEISVGRVIAPLAYDVNDKLSIAGSLDFVWAGIDLQMATSEAQFQDMANPAAQNIGTLSGTMADAFGRLYEPFGGTGVKTLHHTYLDFSNGNSFTGKAKAYGMGGKLGLIYKITPQLTFGTFYHTKTALSDVETDHATLSFAVNMDPGVLTGTPGGNFVDTEIAVKGKVSIKDFQWPETFGVGFAFQPTARLMMAMDIKVIRWSDVMKDFNLEFTADKVPENGGFAGQDIKVKLFQNWGDQIVFAIGGAYKLTDALTIRAGFNHADNPVPDTTLNAILPVIVEDHITFGIGYLFNKSSSLDLFIEKVLEVKQTNPGNGSTIPPLEMTVSQLNWAVMYSYFF